MASALRKPRRRANERQKQPPWRSVASTVLATFPRFSVRINRTICSNMMQWCDLIKRVCGQFRHGTEAISFPRRVGHCAILAISRLRYPGRFRTAVVVRAFDFRGPHAKAAISGAVLGLAVLDLADRVGRRQIP